MAVNYEFLNNKKTEQAKASVYQGIGVYSNKVVNDFDPNTSEGLYNLAIANGGRPAEVARMITNQEQSMLRKASQAIGGGMKTFGEGILKTLQLSGNIVAGTIDTLSGQGTIGEAIKENRSISDSLLGELDTKNMSTAEKVGAYGVRFAIDTLLDPATYVTLGASRGVLGISALTKIKAPKEAIEAFELSAKTKNIALKEGSGDALYNLSSAKLAGDTDTVARLTDELVSKYKIPKADVDDIIKKLDDAIDEDLKKFLDSKVLSAHAAGEAVTNLFRVAPEMMKPFMDKGGIKFFGETILEGQKLRTVAARIPGVTAASEAVQPFREHFSALFDPKMKWDSGTKQYIKLSDEQFNMKQAYGNLSKQADSEINRQFSLVLKENGIKSKVEQEWLGASIVSQKLPSDPRLANAYREFYGIVGDVIKKAEASGKPISLMMDYKTMYLTKQDAAVDSVEKNLFKINNSAFGMNDTVTSTLEKKNVAFTSVSDTNKRLIADEGSELVQLTKKDFEAKIAAEGVDMADGVTFESKVNEAVTKIKSDLVAASDKMFEQGVRNADVFAANFKQQIAKLDAGDYDNIFFDPKTNDVFVRESLTMPEYLSINGFSMPQDMAGWTGEGAEAMIKELAGEDTNFLESAFGGIARTNIEVANKALYDDLVLQGTKATHAPEGFVALNIPNKIKNADEIEMLYHPDVAEDLENLIKFITTPERNLSDSIPLLRSYDSFMNKIKASLTQWFLPFHTRNFVSNHLLSFLDIGTAVMNPQTWGTSVSIMSANNKMRGLMDDIYKLQAKGEDASKLILQQNQMRNTPVLTDDFGSVWTFGQLIDEMKIRGVAFVPHHKNIRLDKTDVPKSIREKLDIEKKNHWNKLSDVTPFSDEFFPTKGGQWAAGNIEDYGRTLNFISNLKKTGNVSLAAVQTNMAMFDYSATTMFEREIVRRVIPFWSFTRMNMQAQLKAVTSAPGRQIAIDNAMETFTDVFSQDDLTDEQKEMLPSYMKRGFYYLKKDREGNLKSVSVMENLMQQPFDATTLTGVLGSINPILKVFMEQGTGVEFFSGKLINQQTNATAYKHYPKFVKDFIGYEEVDWVDPATGESSTWSVSLKPDNLNLFNNLPMNSRVISAIRQLETTDKTLQEKAMQQLFGFSYSGVDIQRIEKNQEKAVLNELSQMMDTAGITYQYKRNLISKQKQ